MHAYSLSCILGLKPRSISSNVRSVYPTSANSSKGPIIEVYLGPGHVDGCMGVPVPSDFM
jgi:hypothetical protein